MTPPEDLTVTKDLPKLVYDYCLIAARLGALGRMSGFVMHEIRNSLTIIYSAVQLIQIKSDKLEPQELSQRLNQVLEQVEAIQKIINKIGRFSERERGVWINVQPDVNVDVVLESLERKISSSGVVIERTAEPSLRQISCEASLLDFVLLELISECLESGTSGAKLQLESLADSEYWRLKARLVTSDYKHGIELKTMDEFGCTLLDKAISRFHGRLFRNDTSDGWTLSIPWET